MIYLKNVFIRQFNQITCIFSSHFNAINKQMVKHKSLPVVSQLNGLPHYCHSSLSSLECFTNGAMKKLHNNSHPKFAIMFVNVCHRNYNRHLQFSFNCFACAWILYTHISRGWFCLYTLNHFHKVFQLECQWRNNNIFGFIYVRYHLNWLVIETVHKCSTQCAYEIAISMNFRQLYL